MRKPGKLGENQGTDLSRLPSRSAVVATGDQRPTTRTAGGPAGAPRCQILPHTNEKSQAPQKRYLTFLAGAEGLEPSARGFGVDVEKCTREQGRGGVVRFLPQDQKRVVLVWCCEKNPRQKREGKPPWATSKFAVE